MHACICVEIQACQRTMIWPEIHTSDMGGPSHTVSHVH